ncbi:hypothetical protein ERX35_007615 [Macrococcus equipercicus]|uniref:Uncharacterized protein n=1 Tax=Macrococcus equipercicus TaxID=69967 RepID=A0ABQ6R7J2_9STAP|nr:hypothetical protein [Macrococcus equipercicus]KAA1039073.1 hypothetical protein ERX35_007615 [Macrococcus equipercicus]
MLPEPLIVRYLENHYAKYFDRHEPLKITQLKDKGYYYEFNLWRGKVVTIGESVTKVDLMLYQRPIEEEQM